MLSKLLLWSFGLRDYAELIFDYESIKLPRYQYFVYKYTFTTCTRNQTKPLRISKGPFSNRTVAVAFLIVQSITHST